MLKFGRYSTVGDKKEEGGGTTRRRKVGRPGGVSVRWENK
jgi:hypothetical protein